MARGVIFDLDGTVIDTESICYEVSRRVVSGHGKTLTQEIIRVRDASIMILIGEM